MSDCPGADLILLSLHDLIEDPAEAERFAQHLSTCEGCTSERRALEGALATPPVLEPPPEVLASLHKQIAEEAAKAPRPLPADVRVRLLCTYCKDDLPRESEETPDPEAQTVYCATCLAPCHRECFDDHGSCAAPGCDGRSLVYVRPLPTPEPARPLRSAAILLLSAVLGGGIAAAMIYPQGKSAAVPTLTSPAPSVGEKPPAVEQRRAWSARHAMTYIGGAAVVELDFGGDPTTPVQSRSLPSREIPEPTLLHVDGVARVDWIQPSPEERAHFLVQGLGEGHTECKVEFADGSEPLTIRIEVSGDDPHALARSERQTLDRETRSKHLLAQLRAEALQAGEALLKECKLPGKEGNYRKAFLQFARASDAAEALGAAEGRRGGRTQGTSDWIKRTRFAELRANVEWEEACHLALNRLHTLWTAPPSEGLRQQQGELLAQTLRLVQHSCDARFRRLEVILQQSFPELMGKVQLELCPHDERAKPAQRDPLPPGLAMIQQGIVISLLKEKGQVVVQLGSKVLSRPEDWTGGEPKDAPVWARLEAELLLLRERAGARASLLLEASPDLPSRYVTLAMEAISRSGITEVSLVVSSGIELSERERRDLAAYRRAVDMIRSGQVSRFDLARKGLKTIDPESQLSRHARAYLDWLDADAEVRQAQAFYAAGNSVKAFQLLSDAYNHPSLDRLAKESVHKLRTRWSRVVRSYDRALEHETAGRLKEAIREFREVIAQEPDRDNALNRSARERVETALQQLTSSYKRKMTLVREAYRKEDWRAFHTWASEVSRDENRPPEDLEWIRKAVAEANVRLRLYKRCQRAFMRLEEDKYLWCEGVLLVLATWLPETDAAGKPNEVRAEAHALRTRIVINIKRWQGRSTDNPVQTPAPSPSPLPQASRQPVVQSSPLESGAVLGAPPFKASLENTLHGALLKIEGQGFKYPDATKLHVRLMIAPRAPQTDPAEVAFFMTPVAGERFRAVKHFNKRKLIPGSYTVSLELLLADQRQAIGRLIRLEYGLPRDARVLLGKTVIPVGTPEEAAAYDKAWRLELTQRLSQYQGIQKRLVLAELEVRRSGQAPSKETFEDFVRRLRMAPLRQDKVVSRPGSKGPLLTLIQVQDAQANAARALMKLQRDRAQVRLKEAAALLAQAEQALR